MPRALKILSPHETAGEVVDTLLLKFEDRAKQQGFVFGGKGTCIEFDFPEPPLLRTDDRLLLDNGHIVEVVADVEPVLEVREKDFVRAARLVLALGNGHVPVQILAHRLRVPALPDVAQFLTDRGFKPETVMAPFEPEDGSAHGHDHHDHGHHHHDHTHHHHDHAHHHDHGHHHDQHHAHHHGREHAHGDEHGHDHQGHDHGHRHGKA